MYYYEMSARLIINYFDTDDMKTDKRSRDAADSAAVSTPHKSMTSPVLALFFAFVIVVYNVLGCYIYTSDHSPLI